MSFMELNHLTIVVLGLYSNSLCFHLVNGRVYIDTMNENKGHFTHEPRAMTMKLWEPKNKCPKAVPRHLQNHVVWLPTLKCSVKSYVTGPSTKCSFKKFLFMRVLTHDKIDQQLWAFKVPWSPSLVLGLPPRGGFGKESKWPWNTIHWMPHTNPCRVYIHLTFTYSYGPSSIVWSSELGPAPPFLPTRVLEV